MADTEALRAALCRAETAILDVAKLLDPTALEERQPPKDFKAVGYVVRKWREVLEAGDWPGPNRCDRMPHPPIRGIGNVRAECCDRVVTGIERFGQERISMRTLVLLLIPMVVLISTLTASSAFSSSYMRKDPTAIIDPIQCWQGCVGDHPYSGSNLEPGASLSGADLSGARLTLAALWEANLVGADLSGVDLFDAWLIDTDLSNADLSGARMWDVILSNADLSGANLSGADLRYAYFCNTDLTGADLTGANLSHALYDEFTLFPSGNTYDNPPWDLDGGIEPWNAGMILVPEPSIGLLVLFGALGLAGLAGYQRLRA
jgi:hypothetical protein